MFVAAQLTSLSDMSLSQLSEIERENRPLFLKSNGELDLNKLISGTKKITQPELVGLAGEYMAANDLSWMQSIFGVNADCKVTGFNGLPPGTGLGVDLFVPGGTAIKFAGPMEMFEISQGYRVFRGLSGKA